MKQPSYTIVVEPDDEGWLAYIPALPACYAPGDTPQEALHELQVVYKMILEEFEEERKPLPADVTVTAGAPKLEVPLSPTLSHQGREG